MTNDQPSHDASYTDTTTESTFHHFQRLPLELRIQIWALTAFPRLMQIKTVAREHCYGCPEMHNIVCVRSSTPAPAVMHACQESRKYAPYKQAFTIGSLPRYTWVNFAADMIWISHWALDDLSMKPHFQDIRRLKLTVGDGGSFEHVVRYGRHKFRVFTELREVHLFDTTCVWDWAEVWEDGFWGGCLPENVRIIEEATGSISTVKQIKAMDDFHRFWSFDGDGRVRDRDNIDQEIRDVWKYNPTIMNLHDIILE